MALLRTSATRLAAVRRRHLPPWLRAVQGLRLPWLLAIVGVCGVAVLLAQAQDVQSALPALLATAPVLPLLCVAGSYGGRADPFAEVVRTTPTGALWIMLIRSGQVVLLCLVLLMAMTLLLPDGNSPVGAAAWLLPSLALTLLTLLIGSFTGCWPAALLTMTGWMLAVASLTQLLSHKPEFRHLPLVELPPKVLNHLIGESSQAWWAVVAAGLTFLLSKRRDAFDRAGGRR